GAVRLDQHVEHVDPAGTAEVAGPHVEEVGAARDRDLAPPQWPLAPAVHRREQDALRTAAEDCRRTDEVVAVPVEAVADRHPEVGLRRDASGPAVDEVRALAGAGPLPAALGQP